MQHPLIAGNSLESYLPPFSGNRLWGPRLKIVLNGKNDKNWTIRSKSPKSDIARIWRLFRDYKRMGLKELATLNEGLRYSPSSYESKKV